MNTVVELLTPITEAGIPVFAVLGNHDYIVEAEEELTAGLESIGVTVLLNESAEIPTETEAPLHVVGLGPAHEDMADHEAAFDGLEEDAARLVLMHNPDTFLPCRPIVLPGLLPDIRTAGKYPFLVHRSGHGWP